MTGYIFAIGATAIWSANFIIARGLSDSISPITLAFWRWIVAVLVFLPFALKKLILEWSIVKKHILYLILTAFLGITTFNTLVYFAGHTTTAINLSLISITFPIFIIILSRLFFKDLFTLNKAIGILLVAAGVVSLITKGDFSKLLNLSFAIGDLWMLIASIIFAFYSIILRRKPEELSIWTLQLSTFILGLIMLFPFFILDTQISTPPVFEIKIILAIFYVGIFASLSAFVLWNKAVAAVGPSKAGMVYYTLPLFSGFLAWYFLGEEIGIVHFYSMLLIVPGILLANYEPEKV
ncbi:MAG: EamA/RhaT family transporter [Spirochaetes bacterium]|nr:MAG: EamA/RhaT family transporter [Spirochaetota bacterium]